MKNKYRFIPSKKNNIVLILIIISILITFVGYIYYKNEKAGKLKEKTENLESIARLKIEQISTWFKRRENESKFISKRSFFLEDLIKYDKTKDEKIRTELTGYLKAVIKERQFTEAILVSVNQTVISTSGTNINNLDSTVKAGVIETSKTKSVVHLHFFKSSEFNNKIFTGFAIPIFDSKNSLLGTLILLINPDDFLFPLVKYWPVESRTAENLIFRKEGDYVLFLNELKYRSNSGLDFKLPINQKDLPAAKAALGFKGIVEGKDYRGVKVFAYVDSIPGTDWYMVSKIDESELFEDMYDELELVIVIIVLFISLTGITLFFLYNERQKNIYQELYNNEKALAHLEERFRTTVESLADGIITADTDGRVQYMNKVAEKLTGWNLKEAKGKWLHDIYFVRNELTGEKENNIVEKVLKYGVIKELANHTLLISKTGEEIPVSDAGAPVYDKEMGIITGLVLTFHDEIEKRNQKKLIEESEKRFRSTLDNMFEGCQIIDNDWRYVYVNESAAKHGKAEKKDLIGKTMMEMYPGIENTEMFRTLKYCRENSVRKQIENTFIFPDGSKGWFELNIEPVFEGLFILSVDLTERKLIEDAFKESEEKYREIVENINDAIYIMNLEGVIEYMSPTIEKLSGFMPEYFLGKHFSEFLKEQNAAMALNTLNEFKNGNSLPMELKIFTKNGEKKWIRISRAPIVKDDKIKGMRGVISDITERMEFLEQLREAKEKAEEMNRIKSHFFASMSHELRTPFVGINGFAELLLETCNKPEAKEMAQGILNSSLRMQDTLTKILDLSKLEFQGVEATIRQIEVKKVIDEVKARFEKAAQKKNLTLSLKSNFDKCVFASDQRLLSEILDNLVSNAIIYTDKGSIEIVSEIKTENENSVLSISVIDTGIGIPKNKQSIIWDEFRQVSEGFNRSFQGTGLGLSITKKYCELLGGKISLESEEGKGSTFKVEFPLPNVKNNVPEPVKEKSPSSVLSNNNYKQSDKRILCVEDDKISIEVLRRFLSKSYIIDFSLNASDALDKLQQNKYDAILMDINLGRGLDGEQLTRKIRLMPEFNSIPIVAVTAYASEDDRKEFLAAGMDYYISKPFMMKDLLDLLEKVFKT